jgi:hypothetical protein
VTSLRPIAARKTPCDVTEQNGACPFRLDAEPGEFTAERFEKLADTAGAPGAEVPVGGQWFACHKTAGGKEIACAGWLAVCGVDHIGVRMAVSAGEISPELLRRPPGGPALFDSYEDMATQQARGMYRPQVAAEWRRRAGHGGFVTGTARLAGGRDQVCAVRDADVDGDRGSADVPRSSTDVEPYLLPTDGPPVDVERDLTGPGGYVSHWPGGLGG